MSKLPDTYVPELLSITYSARIQNSYFGEHLLMAASVNIFRFHFVEWATKSSATTITESKCWKARKGSRKTSKIESSLFPLLRGWAFIGGFTVFHTLFKYFCCWLWTVSCLLMVGKIRKSTCRASVIRSS